MSELGVGKKRRRRTKEKDPNAPKRPRSAYILFCSERRNDAKAIQPDAGATDILKLLGQMWQQLTPEEKVPWVEKAEMDKQRYKQEMMHYVPPVRPKGKKKRDPSAPKRACSAYIFFGAAIRDQIKADMPDAKNTDILRETGARWQKLSDADRQIYQQQAAADRARYEREIVSYNVQQQARQQAAQQQAVMQAQQRAVMPGTLGMHEEQYGMESNEYRPPPPHHPHAHHPHNPHHYY